MKKFWMKGLVFRKGDESLYSIELFAKRLDKLLEANKMNVYTLSKCVGISQSWFSDVLNCKKANISLDHTCKIANFFGVDINFFIDSETSEAEIRSKVVELAYENLRLKDKISQIAEVLSDG